MRKYLIIIIIGILLSLCYAIVSSEKDTECLNRQKITAVDGESMEQTEHSNERVRPLKGRPFQELVDLCEELNDILFCTMLKSEQRAEALLAKGAPMEYTALIEMAKLVNLSEKQQCDAPCFAAIQDSIIRSATDETLDVYWYYEIQGQDSVLMFNMKSYKRDIGEFDAQTTINALNERAAKENENAERFFSPDSRYAVHVVKSIDPYTYEMILAEESIAETNHFVDGIRLIDLNTNSDRTLVEPGQEGIHEHIGNIVWSLESDCIYFTGISDTAGCSEVFRCDIETGSIESLASGGVIELILDDPYVGYLKILDTCFVKDEGGRHWYLAAVSPDGKTRIKLSKPSLNIPIIP